MKNIIIRLLCIEAVALSIAGVINFINHNSYWEKTIFRTQTVDFNILSHTLPTKLSYALQKNDVTALQQTLNSNYELFGLVVTNCKTIGKECTNQKIQYLSKFGSKPRAWKNYLKPANLKNYPYSLLQNPPPLYAEWQYKSPHSKDNERQISRKINKGEIIGRVYYVRGVPPNYLDDIKRWIQNPSLDSGAGRVYSLSFIVCLLAGFSVWAIIEMIIYRKAAEEKQLVLEHQNLAALEATRTSEAERQIIHEKNKLLEIENKLARTRGFIGVIQEVIEQDFSSVVSNRLQELQGVFRRLNADIDNITHDLRKAPLIRSGINVSDKTLEKLNYSKLTEVERDKVLSNIATYVEDADETVKSISWAIDGLNEIANLEPVSICVQEEIENFSKNLPPNLCKKWLCIDFHFNSEEQLIINCNSWHLKSIVKNVLYNSSGILIKSRLAQGSAFQGRISVTCLRVGDEAGILVEDNGPGYSDRVLERLYQATGVVNENAEPTRGRGSVIVFSYLSLHGGRVELKNKPEGGAKALFLFPLIPSISSKS